MCRRSWRAATKSWCSLCLPNIESFLQCCAVAKHRLIPHYATAQVIVERYLISLKVKLINLLRGGDCLPTGKAWPRLLQFIIHKLREKQKEDLGRRIKLKLCVAIGTRCYEYCELARVPSFASPLNFIWTARLWSLPRGHLLAEKLACSATNLHNTRRLFKANYSLLQVTRNSSGWWATVCLPHSDASI